MKKDAAIVAERPIALARKSILKGICGTLFLIFLGCATTHPPATTKQEMTPSPNGAAVTDKQRRKEAADPSIAALAALLKSRNIISAEEAAALTGQPATPGAAEKERMEKTTANVINKINRDLQEQATGQDQKALRGKGEEGSAAAPEWAERVRFGGDIRLRSESDRLNKESATVVKSGEPVTVGQEETPSGSDAALPDKQRQEESVDPSLAALVALLRSKNVISAEEASRLAGHSLSKVEEKGTAVISEASEDERIEKITARAIELIMANIQDQVKKQVREELAKEMKVHEKEQIDSITASVTQEVKKSLPEQAKSEVRAELPAEVSKRESETVTTSVTQEVRKDLQERVRAEVQQQIAKEMKVHEKEQIDSITASVTEEVRKSLPEQVKSELRAGLPGETSEKITASVTEEVKKEVQEQVRSQVKEEVAKEVKDAGLVETAAEWLKKRINIYGDVRLRYQGDFFDKDNVVGLLKPSNPTQILNTTEDRNRFLLRARLGVTAQITDEVEAGIRIATGYTNIPVSQNVTLGDYENNKNIVLDLGYLRWKPWPNVSLWGGRFQNPFYHPYSELVWDVDLYFDGVALNYTQKLNDRFALFVNALGSPLQEIELSSHDKWLLGAQLGLQHTPWNDVSYRIAGAYYDFINVAGQYNNPLGPPNQNDWTAPQFLQKGNTYIDINGLFPPGTQPILLGVASDFRLVNITGDIELGFWKPVYVTLLGDYVKNVGFDSRKVALKTGNPNLKEETEGYQVGLSVGHKQYQKFGDWEVFFAYKRVGSDAVLDAFTDSDFHAGGTNAKGWILSASLALYKNIWLRARWMTTDQISGPPLAIDTFQLDLNARF
ncbi:MAG TPA: putative porin [Thermodesulfobacteriota bacterium]|nr:putative porin [Thermodesulfobacteriota bacterium]